MEQRHMTSEHSQIEQFMNWVQTFDPSLLQNEDDVETKFVLPLFQYLGYADKHRRGKYPLKAYNPGKRGRKPEIDTIYFSTDQPKKQGPDTSLLLVEAKKPNELNLDKDVDQAVFYGDKLKILFHVVTNGYQLKVFKRHRYHDDECIYDISTSELRNRATLTRFYELLHFDVVKHLKELAVNELTHTLYVEMTQTLNRYPNLLAQIAKGDFNSYVLRGDRHIVVSKPRVAVDCQLPLVLREGSCQIEFSNVMLRGLTCQLTHDDIVRDLLIGLHTPPEWEARCFIKKRADGTFEARLGQTIVLLSEQETQELCACVDMIGEAYKEALLDTMELLEAWDYTFTQTFEFPGCPDLIRGFSLLSVRPWLWQLMKQFAHEFDFLKGDSDWHMFDEGIHSIGIHRNRQGYTNVTLWPVSEGGSVPNDWVDILYYDPDEDVELYEDVYKQPWKQLVGTQGIWTVRYTHEWIIQQFIPQVLAHYNVHYQKHQYPLHRVKEWVAGKLVPHVFSGYELLLQRQQEAQQQAIIKHATLSGCQKEQIPLSEESELKHLAPYLHHIQGWLVHYGLIYGTRRIAASLLRPYYTTFTELGKSMNPATVNIGYIQGKLGYLERIMREDLRREGLTPEEEEAVYDGLSTYDGILRCLSNHVIRIHKVEYEDVSYAELISRAFISMAEHEDCSIGQDQLNSARRVLLPLWEQSRFEERFIRALSR